MKSHFEEVFDAVTKRSCVKVFKTIGEKNNV